MDESLLGIASEIKPNKEGFAISNDMNESGPGNKRYTINPENGEKIRLKGNAPRKSANTKSERKKERSDAFWDRL